MNDRIAAIRRALLEQYDRDGRSLPWRGESDPYKVLVSEVMLQQTRVETVKRYYGAWLERFPTLESLASAEEAEVLKAWEGLGYYRRARNLHAAARAVRDREDGVMPADPVSLRALPGVGEYTSGAVASIAFGVATPAVDGNVRRVLARLYDVAEPTASWLREEAGRLVERDRPGDWNQALMDLGATICTPRAPRCDACPLSTWCDAYAEGTVALRPAPARRGSVRSAHFLLGIFHREEEVWMNRRPAEGLLGGMWAFPEIEVEEPPSSAVEAGSLLADLADSHGLEVGGVPEEQDGLEHRFTHLAARYHPWSAEAESGGSKAESGHSGSGSQGRWVDAPGAASLAIPVAQRKLLDRWWSRSESLVESGRAS